MLATELISELSRAVARDGDKPVMVSARKEDDGRPVTVSEAIEVYDGALHIFIRDHIPGETLGVPAGPMKTSWDHLLHLTEIDCGAAYFKLTCEHPDPSPEHPQWACRRPPEAPDTDDDNIDEPLWDEGCWLMSWWDAMGDELVTIKRDDMPTTSRWPLPVKPSSDWTDDGGSIVFDPSFINQPAMCAPLTDLYDMSVANDASRPYPFLDIKDIS